MSILVVGLSHRTAPMALLERVALSGDGTAAKLAATVCDGDCVGEAMVLSTCNRLEVYADVSKFHAGVAEVGAALGDVTGVPFEELSGHLYVHYEAAAVAHLFTVASGLDSMAIGETQVLGQVRSALRVAQEAGTAGRVIDPLVQQALRVGKRGHAETGLDTARVSMLETGLALGGQALGGPPVAGRAALVIGAGSMSAVAAATLQRTGVQRLTIANRTAARAERLAGSLDAGWVPMAELATALAGADIVISCTSAPGPVVLADDVAAAQRARQGRPQLYLDLALPRDVEPAVAGLTGAHLVDLESVGAALAGHGLGDEVDAVRAIVTEEVAGYLATQRAEAVAPTVVALRSHARSVVDAELARLTARLDGVGVDARARAEFEQTVHRIVEKLLHTPTVRIKELAGEPGGDAYAEALRELFGLDLGRIAAVSGLAGEPGQVPS